MPKVERTLSLNKCNRCNYEWKARKGVSVACPSCHSAYWDRERVRKRKVIKNGNDKM